jgi:hypothetical protein
MMRKQTAGISGKEALSGLEWQINDELPVITYSRNRRRENIHCVYYNALKARAQCGGTAEKCVSLWNEQEGKRAAFARPHERVCDIITVSKRHVSYDRNKYPSRNEHSD